MYNEFIYSIKDVKKNFCQILFSFKWKYWWAGDNPVSSKLPDNFRPRVTSIQVIGYKWILQVQNFPSNFPQGQFSIPSAMSVRFSICLSVFLSWFPLTWPFVHGQYVNCNISQLCVCLCFFVTAENQFLSGLKTSGWIMYC